MKEGPLCGSLDVLKEEEVSQIHSAAISLLQDPGIYSESDLFLDLFQRGGANVDHTSRKIQVPAEMVDEALETAPKSYIIYGRDPDMDLLAESGRVYFGMGGTSEPFFWDYQLGISRDPTKEDMVQNTRLGQALPNIDFVMTMCSSGDYPKQQVLLHDYDAIFRNTTKPVVYSVVGQEETTTILKMAAAACGGEAAFRERPWGMAMVTPVSPLVLTHLSEGIFELIDFNVPILYAAGPMMGATGPTTVAGTLVLAIAEVLFGVVLSQLIKPGIPVIMKPDPNAFDMVTAQCTYGSPEQNLAKAAMAQLGRFYNLPTFTMGGGVEAKLPDAEASAEAMHSMLLNALSGVTLSQSLGTLASGLYGSQEMLVICDEMVHMVKRVLEGITITEETIALDVIRDVGPGGSFLVHDHTAMNFRKELFFPKYFPRQSIDQWKERGAKPIVDVVHEKVKEILASAEPVVLPKGAEGELDRSLQTGIERLVN
jgi:trimethylamine--corrinoid protein Co-methyltransferase